MKYDFRVSYKNVIIGRKLIFFLFDVFDNLWYLYFEFNKLTKIIIVQNNEFN